MYIEKYSTDELMELIEMRGYASMEAAEILQEMESAKRRYDYLIQVQGRVEDEMSSDLYVVHYYLYLMEQIRMKIPYDDMGAYYALPLFILNEFRKNDIVERIRVVQKVPEEILDVQLRQEVQRFITVHLEPKGIILYMEILENQPLKVNHIGELRR